jgi:phosphoglycerate dehydrogenase-like enzyme
MPAHTLLVLNSPADRHLVPLERLPGETRIVVGDSLEAFLEAAPEADTMLVGDVERELLEAVWARAPRLQWVHMMWAGVEGLLFPALVESPVTLTNGRGVFAHALAEFAISGMLWFAKDIRRMRRQQQAARWDRFTVRELRGALLGIIGHGSIGRATAALATAFGMRVRGVGRHHAREEFDWIIEHADYLLVSTPLTHATRGLIGEGELRRMKPSSVLINLGRGPVVNEPALIRALNEAWIRGAVLDVYDQEPLPADHPFWAIDNAVVSPHCADNTETWLNEALELFIENFQRFCSGEALRNVVDKAQGY